MTTFHAEMPANCPLPTAAPCDCVVYRGCASSALQESDFKTHAELGLAKTAKGDQACTRFGLSVFPSKAHCEHMLEVFPQNGNYVAEGKLATNHGQIADTPSKRFPAHKTWWPFEGVQRTSMFA